MAMEDVHPTMEICTAKYLNKKQDKNKRGIHLGVVLSLGIGLPIVIFITLIAVIARWRHTHTSYEMEEQRYMQNLVTEGEQVDKKDEFVKNGVDVLASENLLYLVGKPGNAVSSTGKNIVERVAQKYGMERCYYNYLDIPNEFSPKTVNFVDGWCGLWNINPCEIETTKNKLAQIISCCEQANLNIKFVVGIRTDVKQELREHKFHFDDNKTVILDTFSNLKQEQVSKKLELMQTNCSNNACRCKTLAIKNINNIPHRHIGTPLIANLMDIDHSMIQEFLDKKIGPMEAMKNHIKDLQSEDTELFNFLLYIVVVGHYDQHDFNEKFAQEFDVAKNDFEKHGEVEKLTKYTKIIEKSKLAPMWAATISENNLATNVEGTSGRKVCVFRHNFLYICAFQACFALYPEKMMRNCNIDALLQLLRPIKKDRKRTEPFTVAVNAVLIDFFCERIKGTQYEAKLSNHPLIRTSKRSERNTPEHRNTQIKRIKTFR